MSSPDAPATPAAAHVPVMCAEVADVLRAGKAGRFLDCTFGGGGHTVAILNSCPDNEVVACDRDQSAIRRGKELAGFAKRLSLRKAAFSELGVALKGEVFNGVIADLGVSTHQLKEGRGFSFSETAALDMRMDKEEGISAAQLLNTTAENKLYALLRRGGVGAEARRIAKSICAFRPLHETEDLVRAVTAVYSGKPGKKTHPATVVFQAVRMAVNRELEELSALLDIIPGLLAKGGRAAFITFHSLEDKAVMQRMRLWQSGEPMPASWPGSRKAACLGNVLSKKPIVPAAAEIAANPASRSARLRVFEFAE